jgi:hypothetical protein
MYSKRKQLPIFLKAAILAAGCHYVCTDDMINSLYLLFAEKTDISGKNHNIPRKSDSCAFVSNLSISMREQSDFSEMMMVPA